MTKYAYLQSKMDRLVNTQRNMLHLSHDTFAIECLSEEIQEIQKYMLSMKVSTAKEKATLIWKLYNKRTKKNVPSLV